MGELLIGVFDGEPSAPRVLRELRASNVTCASVGSAGTVSVSDGGGFEVCWSGQIGSSTGFSGLFWGTLFALVLLPQAPGSSYGPKVGALFGTLSQAGVDEAFRTRARRAFTAGTSAIGMLSSDDEAPAVNALLAWHTAKVVRTSLSPGQEVELARELGRVP